MFYSNNMNILEYNTGMLFFILSSMIEDQNDKASKEVTWVLQKFILIIRNLWFNKYLTLLLG